MPLAELGCPHACRRDLAAPAIVVVEPEIVFERVGSHDVVLAVVESKHDAARGVLPAGDRLELHRHVDVGIGTGWPDDDVELVLRRALHEHPLTARRGGHLLDGPLTVDDGPAFDAFCFEVERLSGHVVRHFELLGGARLLMPGPTGTQRQRAGYEPEYASTGDVHEPHLLPAGALGASSRHQSSFSATVFQSVPLTSVTSATG